MRFQSSTSLGWGTTLVLLAAGSLLVAVESRQLAYAGDGKHNLSVLQHERSPLPAAAQWRRQLWQAPAAGRALLGTAAAEATSVPTAAPSTNATAAPTGGGGTKDTNYIVAIVVGGSTSPAE